MKITRTNITPGDVIEFPYEYEGTDVTSITKTKVLHRGRAYETRVDYSRFSDDKSDVSLNGLFPTKHGDKRTDKGDWRDLAQYGIYHKNTKLIATQGLLAEDDTQLAVDWCSDQSGKYSRLLVAFGLAVGEGVANFIKLSEDGQKVVFDAESARSSDCDFTGTSGTGYINKEKQIRELEKFFDILNTHLYIPADHRNPSGPIIKGLPILSVKDHTTHCHVPLIALSAFSFLYGGYCYPKSGHYEDIEKVMYSKYCDGVGWSYFGPLYNYPEMLNIRKVFLCNYDWTKVVSLYSPILEQIMSVSLYEGDDPDVNDVLHLYVPVNEPLSELEKQTQTFDHAYFDGSSRSILRTDERSAMEAYQLEVVNKKFNYTTFNRVEHSSDEEIRKDPNWFHLYESDYSTQGEEQWCDEEVCNNIDVRIGAIMLLFIERLMPKFSPFVRSRLNYQCVDNPEDITTNRNYVGPAFQGTMFYYPGMIFFPLTFLKESNNIRFSPVRDASASLIDGKAIINILTPAMFPDETDSSDLIQGVGGDRTANLLSVPGAPMVSSMIEDFSSDETTDYPPEDDDTYNNDDTPETENPETENPTNEEECDPCQKLDDVDSKITSLATNLNSLKEVLSGDATNANLLERVNLINEQLSSLLQTRDACEDEVKQRIDLLATSVRKVIMFIQNPKGVSTLHDLSKSSTSAALDDAILEKAMNFSQLKLNSPLDGVPCFQVFDQSTDYIKTVNRSKNPINDDYLNDQSKVTGITVKSADSLLVPKFNFSIGRQSFSLTTQPLQDSDRYITCEALRFKAGSLSYNLISGRLFSRDRVSGGSLGLIDPLRLMVAISLNNNLPVFCAGSLKLNADGTFSYNASYAGRDDEFPIYMQYDAYSDTLYGVVHPSYPDACIQIMMHYTSNLNRCVFLDRFSFNNVISEGDLDTVCTLTRSDIYLRRMSVSLIELSSTFIIEIMKYGKTLISGRNISDIATSSRDRIYNALDIYALHEDEHLASEIRSSYDDGLTIERFSHGKNTNCHVFHDNQVFLLSPVDHKFCRCDLIADTLSFV